MSVTAMPANRLSRRSRFPSGWPRAGLLSLCCIAQAVADSTAGLLDLDTLVRPGSPNSYLLGPRLGPPGEPDAPAGEFGVPAARPAAAWRSVVDMQPRSRVTAASDDGLQIAAEQRSALFGFVDDIHFRAIALGADRSTFVAYSQSRTGYWDLGVNQRRLERWVDALQGQVAAGGQGN